MEIKVGVLVVVSLLGANMKEYVALPIMIGLSPTLLAVTLVGPCVLSDLVSGNHGSKSTFQIQMLQSRFTFKGRKILRIYHCTMDSGTIQYNFTLQLRE